MTEPVMLRAGRPDDHDEIMRIWREASRIGHPFLTEADLDVQERVTRKEHLPQANLVVAERAGRIAGFIATLDDYIGALFVAPQAQGSRVGRRLVEDAQARSASLQLDVYEDNLGARAFYERLGFIRLGRSEHDDEGRPLPVVRLGWSA